MTNNVDDFDDDFQDAQQSQARGQKPGMANNLAAAWRGSPLFKLFVLVIGVGALAAAVIGLFSGNDKDSIGGVSVGSVPGVSAIPGDKAPPAYVEAVNDASKKRADDAFQQGTSALPTPVSGDVTTAGVSPEEKESQYDPLAEFRPNIAPENSTTAVPEQEAVEVIDTDMLAKMQQQMTTLFDAWKPSGIQVVQVQEPRINKAEDSTPNQTASQGKVLIAAGAVHYAQLMIEANSDVPGPIMAEVMSGPFTGARVIGQFEITREYLILHFTKLTHRRKDYGIDALAIDPNTTLGGLVTEKDNRYFTRLVLPAAAGFLEGFGSAISSPSQSVVTSNGDVVVFQEGRQGVREGLYKGLSEAAGTAGSFFRDEAAATKPLIRVAAGTPMGLFFVNSMTDAAGGSPVHTPVDSPYNQPAGPPIPPLGATNPGASPTNLNPSGVTILNPSQSSLANTGVSIIQNTPNR
jgi:intracellular multiplication protein IcmE